jgi:hypothetical protein
LPLREPVASADGRARLLQDRMDLLTKRVGDMELLILVLLGTSGLYAIVFVASSYFSATSFARQADQTIGHIQDQIGLAMGDLRELQEETEQQLHQMTDAHQIAPAPPSAAPEPPQKAPWHAQTVEIAARLNALQCQPLNEQARLELVHTENTVACLEAAIGLSSGSEAGVALAGLYFCFGRIYGISDTVRSRFYLERALRWAAPESTLSSEIHYQLAIHFASSHDFHRSLRELAAAFEHQFKTLDERLAGDIEEGGKLYELASTAPYDKSVNDLLLNMSIGIG